jgi:hypothetical protein
LQGCLQYNVRQFLADYLYKLDELFKITHADDL